MPLTRQQEGQAGQPDAQPKGAGAKRGERLLRFAPGPLADKYCTDDGHPDHEGHVARPKRSLGQSWGTDLTPSGVRELEAQLGEECMPSLDRLKRRVGLLPLRKRPKQYLTWMIDSSSSSSSSSSGEDDEDAGPAPAAKRRRAQTGRPPAGPQAGRPPRGHGLQAPSSFVAATATAAAVDGDAESLPMARQQQQQPATAGEAQQQLGCPKCRYSKTGCAKCRGAAAASAALLAGGGGLPGAPAAAAAAVAVGTAGEPALGGRKPRQKAGTPERLQPPNRLRALGTWAKRPAEPPAPLLPLPQGVAGALGFGPLPRADMQSVTVTFNRKGSRHGLEQGENLQDVAEAASGDMAAAAVGAAAVEGEQGSAGLATTNAAAAAGVEMAAAAAGAGAGAADGAAEAEPREQALALSIASGQALSAAGAPALGLWGSVGAGSKKARRLGSLGDPLAKSRPSLRGCAGGAFRDN